MQKVMTGQACRGKSQEVKRSVTHVRLPKNAYFSQGTAASDIFMHFHCPEG
jgi:hypothetical protein